jgi:hypothetical protein
MSKSKIIITFLLVLSIVFLFNVNLSLADDTDKSKNVPGGCTDGTCEEVKLNNPLGGEGDDVSVNTIIGRVINAILGVIGSLALLMFVYGGITWMTSSGSPEKIKQGRDIIIWSVIGLAIIFFSYALVNFVIFDIIGG